MKNKILTFIFSLFVSVFYFSCCKEGLNGTASIVVYPKRNGYDIINHRGYPDTVYVKFRTHDLPGLRPSDYDTYFTGNSVLRDNHVSCLQLKCGDYYLFVAGFDSTINTRVTGGMHVRISHHDRKKETDVQVNLSE